VRFFSVGNLGSSLSLEHGNTNYLRPEQKRTSEFGLSTIYQVSLEYSLTGSVCAERSQTPHFSPKSEIPLKRSKAHGGGPVRGIRAGATRATMWPTVIWFGSNRHLGGPSLMTTRHGCVILPSLAKRSPLYCSLAALIRVRNSQECRNFVPEPPGNDWLVLRNSAPATVSLCEPSREGFSCRLTRFAWCKKEFH
jgi:hypothetical protein